MALITKDDIFDTYGKLKQRGLSFILSKFNLNSTKRTLSAFDDAEIDASNYWNIPLVKKRWNRKITGNEDEIFEDYVIKTYLQNKDNLKMISLGTGVCNHEIHFALKGNFSEVLCIDFASSLLEKGKFKSKQLGLSNITFSSLDASKMQVKPEYYDIVMFHSSLHHFYNVDYIIENIALKTLKKGGLLIINEYVGPNRLQLTSIQIKAINKALATVPSNKKTRYKTHIVKNTVSGPGILRMILSDPSECVESEKILPSIKKHFKTLEEKSIGGNLLMFLFKDIAHNFISTEPEVEGILNKIFDIEDEFLKVEKSNFIFGVYQKPC